MNYKEIRNYEESIIEDLRELVAIPSVASDPEEGYPFGRNAARALEYILERAKALGFKTKNIGNAAGYAEYGEGEEYAGVLTHVDVVPVGEGWDTDPFTLTERDGRLLGRGVADDKGAAVVALWCLKALSDQKAAGKRRLRCIFGCGEEVGMEDMETFFASEPLPEVAFTPDSGYTVCNREKGILQIFASVAAGENTPILSFEAGSAVNCVAQSAKAFIACGDGTAAQICEKVKESGCECEYAASAGGFVVEAKGSSAHAMNPSAGKNAATALLGAIDFVIDEADLVLSSICRLFCRDIDGSGLDIAQSDLPSGKLTMNLGSVRFENGRYVFGIDIRYPVTASGKSIISKVKTSLEACGMRIESTHHVEPIYMPENDRLIQALCGCYEEVTGQKANVYSTGGGTYARSLGGRGVAFGMEFPDSPETRLHEANEGFEKEDLMKHAEICMAAMHHMMKM